MSKRSWNNGTRKLEEIAGSVIFNEGYDPNSKAYNRTPEEQAAIDKKKAEFRERSKKFAKENPYTAGGGHASPAPRGVSKQETGPIDPEDPTIVVGGTEDAEGTVADGVEAEVQKRFSILNDGDPASHDEDYMKAAKAIHAKYSRRGDEARATAAADLISKGTATTAGNVEDAEGIVGNLDDEVDASNEEDDDVTEVVEGIVDRVFDVSDKVIDFVTKPTQYDDAFAKDILSGIKRGSKIANRTLGGVVKGAGEVVKGVAKGIGEVGKGAIQGATEDGENKSLKDEFLEFAEKVSAVDEGRDIDIMVLRSELNRLDDILADKEHAAAQREM